MYFHGPVCVSPSQCIPEKYDAGLLPSGVHNSDLVDEACVLFLDKRNSIGVHLPTALFLLSVCLFRFQQLVCSFSLFVCSSQLVCSRGIMAVWWVP